MSSFGIMLPNRPHAPPGLRISACYYPLTTTSGRRTVRAHESRKNKNKQTGRRQPQPQVAVAAPNNKCGCLRLLAAVLLLLGSRKELRETPKIQPQTVLVYAPRAVPM